MIEARRFLRRIITLFRSARADAELSREINAHLRLLEDDFIARGMNVADARYETRRTFGGVEQAKERQRDARAFRWLAGWPMDLRLGARMLVKYPGLTVLGGLAIAFAIAVGAAAFEVLIQLTAPTLPLEDGDRIVGIRTWDTAARREESRTSHDFMLWREELDAVENLGAFRTVERNLIVDGQGAESVQVAEISASAFRVARVAPVIGRPLLDADEHAGSPPVIVIGYEVWHTRFGGDSRVIGRSVHLGRTRATIVGVMPAGFAFPVSHRVWAPLRLNVGEYARREGPGISLFGRLADGVSIQQAQAALTMIGLRTAAAFPGTHGQLRPEVLPFARSVLDVTEVALGGTAINVFVVMFLVLVCANVAALAFARAVTRHREIVVRSALGATRGRIMAQLFVEALVLGGVAAIIGLIGASAALRWWMAVFEAEASGRLAFWFDSSLSPATIVYALLLTLVSAAIVGILPALKVTSRRVESQLREAAAAGKDLRFGGVWTVVVVSQVAVTVAFPAAAFFARQHVTKVQSLDFGFPAAQYLSAGLAMDPDAPSSLPAAYRELERRLSADPGVIRIAFTDRLPGTTHPARAIEIDGLQPVDSEATMAHRVSVARVGLGYFDALGAAMISGRAFNGGDLHGLASGPSPSRQVVIVNESFVRRVLGGRNAVGERVRYVSHSGEQENPWFEIVGVVPDLGMIHDDPRNGAGLYHPVGAGAAQLNVIVHVRENAETFAPRVRAHAAAVDPALQLHDLRRMGQASATLWMEMDFLWRLLGLISSIALLLSLAGIYSVTSFTVSRRTREIGIRVALGADARRIVSVIFARAVAQVALGIAAGGALVSVQTKLIIGLTPTEIAVIAAYMTGMIAVCLLACAGPTRRALRVEPTEALRIDG